MPQATSDAPAAADLGFSTEHFDKELALAWLEGLRDPTNKQLQSYLEIKVNEEDVRQCCLGLVSRIAFKTKKVEGLVKREERLGYTREFIYTDHRVKTVYSSTQMPPKLLSDLLATTWTPPEGEPSIPFCVTASTGGVSSTDVEGTTRPVIGLVTLNDSWGKTFPQIADHYARHLVALGLLTREEAGLGEEVE